MTENRVEWITTKEVAEMLGVSVSKARNVIKERHLTVFTVGKRWRILKDDVDLLVAEARVNGGI